MTLKMIPPIYRSLHGTYCTKSQKCSSKITKVIPSQSFHKCGTSTTNYDTNPARLTVSSKWNFVETKNTLLFNISKLTVLSLISAPGACKIQMKNLNISLFLISVLFGGTIYKIKFLLKYETMRVKNNEIYDWNSRKVRKMQKYAKKSLKNTVFK